MNVKSIGEVLLHTPVQGQHVVRVTRYGSGRKLPEPRYLLDDGHPFATPMAALAALNQWKAEPRSLKQLHEVPAAPKAKRVRKAKTVRVPDDFVEPTVRCRETRVAPMPLPAAEKRASVVRQTEIDPLVAFWTIVGRTTKCPEFVRRNLNPKRGGGMMPAHLNPLTMGEIA